MADNSYQRTPNKHYNFKSGFETNRDKVVDQDNGRQNNPMNLSTSDSTPLDANTTNGTTSPINSITVRTKLPKPMPLTLPTDSPALPMNFQEENGKSNVPGDLDPDPSFSDSSKKSNLLNEINSSKSKKKKRDKKKNIGKTRKMTCQTHRRATILIRPMIVITDAKDKR